MTYRSAHQRLSVSLPPDVLAYLSEYAPRYGSKSGFISHVVRQWVVLEKNAAGEPCVFEIDGFRVGFLPEGWRERFPHDAEERARAATAKIREKILGPGPPIPPVADDDHDDDRA